jgi:hypothetical protein
MMPAAAGQTGRSVGNPNINPRRALETARQVPEVLAHARARFAEGKFLAGFADPLRLEGVKTTL